MLRVLAKAGFSGGAVTGVAFLHTPLLTKSNLEDRGLEGTSKKIEKIEKFEDISIYAKQKGCILSFENQWKHNTSYSAEQFIQEEAKNRTFDVDTNFWKTKMLNYFKENEFKCEPNSVTVFFYYDAKGVFVLDSKEIKYQTNDLEKNGKIRKYGLT